MRRLVIVAMLLAAGAAARADTIYLRNGQTYQGTAARKGDKVLIETPMGTFEVPADDVIHVAPGSMPADTTSAPAPAARPVISTEARRPLATDQMTDPEPLVLTLMRNLSATPPGTESYDLRQQIEQWRSIAHDRKRKVGTEWIAPAQMERRKELFTRTLKEADDLLRKIGPPSRAGDPKAEADRKKALVPVLDKLDLAARAWPDPLIHTFLAGIVAYHREDYLQAESLFRKCIDEEPLVAAFHQGRGLALLERDRPLWGLEELLAALNLRPDSRDLLADIQTAMKKVPGTSIKDPLFLEAVRLLALYSDSDKRPYTSQGVTWLMPGREWQTRGESLSTPPYDRLIFRQAVAVPVGKNILLVDAAAVKDGLELLVRIDANTILPAYGRRAGSSSRSAPALTAISVPGCEFTVPRLIEDGNTVPAEGPLTAWVVPSYSEMGSLLRRVTGKAGGAATDGSVIVSATLAAGDSAAPVSTSDGALIGFLAAKTDIAAGGGGPDRFIPLWQLSQLLRQAKGATPDHSTYGRVKRSPSIRTASGQTFLVTAILGEKLE